MYCTAMRQLIVLPCKYYVKGDKTTILESAIENNICWLRIVWALDHVHMSSKTYSMELSTMNSLITFTLYMCNIYLSMCFLLHDRNKSANSKSCLWLFTDKNKYIGSHDGQNLLSVFNSLA